MASRAIALAWLAVAFALVAVPLLGAEGAPVDGDVVLLEDEVASRPPTKAAKALAGYTKAKRAVPKAAAKAKKVRKSVGSKKAKKAIRKLVPKSKATKRKIMDEVRRVQRDRAKARRTEAVVADMKQEKRLEKKVSKKLQHKQQRAIRKEEKQSQQLKKKQEKRQGKKKSPKAKARRSEVSEYSIKAKNNVISAKSASSNPLHSKKLPHEHTYDEYTNSVDKYPRDKTDHCARCKRRCKTGACKTWCSMRWCAKVTKTDIKKSATRSAPKQENAKSFVCKMCNAPDSSELKRWCTDHQC